MPVALRGVVARSTDATAPYGSASAVAAAARAAVPASRRRRRAPALVAGGVAIVAAAVLALVLVATAGDDGGPRAPAATPAARVAATIPLGGVPGVDSAAAGGSIWVPRADRTLVRIDPATNRVVGAPLRFGRAAEDKADFIVGVRAGDGAVWALDETRGTIARVDPLTVRVTGRIKLGGAVLDAKIVGHTLWAFDGPDGSHLVRFDTRTLRRIPTRSDHVFIQPFGTVMHGDTVGVNDVGDGTVTRVDARTGRSQTARIAAQGLGLVPARADSGCRTAAIRRSCASNRTRSKRGRRWCAGGARRSPWCPRAGRCG